MRTLPMGQADSRCAGEQAALASQTPGSSPAWISHQLCEQRASPGTAGSVAQPVVGCIRVRGVTDLNESSPPRRRRPTDLLSYVVCLDGCAPVENVAIVVESGYVLLANVNGWEVCIGVSRVDVSGSALCPAGDAAQGHSCSFGALRTGFVVCECVPERHASDHRIA